MTTHLAFAGFWVAVLRQAITIARNTLARRRLLSHSVMTRRTALPHSRHHTPQC